MTIAETCHLYRGFPPISIDPRKCAKYSSQEAMSKWPQLGGDFDFRKKIGGFSFFLHTFSSFQKDKKKKKQTHLDFCTGLHDLSFHHSKKKKQIHIFASFCTLFHYLSFQHSQKEKTPPHFDFCTCLHYLSFQHSKKDSKSKVFFSCQLGETIFFSEPF